MRNLDFCKKCYEAYKKSWCDQRGYSLSDWNKEHEFFVSEDEFYSTMFKDKELMNSILSPIDFSSWVKLITEGLAPKIYTVPVQWNGLLLLQ